MTKATQNTNNNTISNGKTIQAQAYAVSKIDLLKSTNYSDLKAESKAIITGTDFFQEVILSSESDYNKTTKTKTVTVKVYNGKESIPRAEIRLTRYSVEQKASGVPIGTIIAWISTKNPTDGTWLDCNGQSCSAYSELVTVLGKSTVPDLRNYFLEGSTTPGKIIEAGLPNITGKIWAGWMGGTGVFARAGYVGASGTGNGYTSSDSCTFDASRSSSIYGKSTTVQPPAVTVRFLIKAA